jgi:acetyltransferase EpsM
MKSMHAAYVGFGGMGRQVANLLRALHEPASETYFDDAMFSAGAAKARSFAEFSSAEHADKSFFVCLGYKQAAIKRRIIQQLTDLGRSVPALIHPSAHVDVSATIAPGAVLFPHCTVDMKVSIGMGTVLHNACVISHDCVLGECCFISPSATLCGRVRLGDECFLGAGTVISNDLTIASRTTLGLGSVITHSIDTADQCWMGNPAKLLSKPLRL